MNRKYSPNHPAVRHHRQYSSGTITERTQAVRDRLGIPTRDPRTGSRAVIALSLGVLGSGLVETHLPIATVLVLGAWAAAWPWLRYGLKGGE